jgi:hypothetical protein
MAELDVMPEGAQLTHPASTTADILIAVPTFNNEATVGSVLKAARSALFEFPQQKAVIAQVDGGSGDSTLARARDCMNGDGSFVQVTYPLYPIHTVELSHDPIPGKESAYKKIFAMAQNLDARACCILRADVAGMTPGSIASLVQPVVDMNVDLAAPLYQRQKYSGFLVNGMLYPAARALFGKRLRQPIGSFFAYSRGFVARCLAEDGWNSEAARLDVDFWLSARGAQGDMKLCQVQLGAPPRSQQDASVDTTAILSGLAGALYSEMEQSAAVWQRIRGSIPIPTFGLRFEAEAEGHPADVKPMLETFRMGCQNLQDIWGLVLPPAALLELRRLSRLPEHLFQFPRVLLARTVYDFAVAHTHRAIGRHHLLHALVPLYMGWIASFILAVREKTGAETEAEIEKLCVTFESEKPYLMSRWRWPDRFMP